MYKLISIMAVSTVIAGASLAPALAQTAQYGYASAVPLSGNTGSDFFGNAWLWSKTTGSAQGPGPGYSDWGTPGLGQGAAVYEGAASSDSFAITFLYPISQILTASINQNVYSSPTIERVSEGIALNLLPVSLNESTQLVVGGQAWDATYAFNNTVIFTAPTGVDITKGEAFSLNVLFNEKNLTGANTAFTATWAGSAVPEASTWAMMLGGFAALGFVGTRRRASGVAS